MKLLLTVGSLWVLLAFNWSPFVKTVNEYQLVDKTKKIVYNIMRSVNNE